jgi:hypothetical protein
MSASPSRRAEEVPTRYLVARGTAAFAGVLLMTVGVFQVIEGIAALAKDSVYVTGVDYTFELDVTAWGWVHLVVGIVGLATGLGIVTGQAWGLLGGMVIACIGAISNFAFMPYFPFWSLAVVGFNVFVIWALSTELTRG